MANIGDAETGFSVEYDALSGTIRVVGWGFWSVEVAQNFSRAVLEAVRAHPRGVGLVMDMSELKPMRDEGQQAFFHMFMAIKTHGFARPHITTTSPLTKLQLMRLAKEAGLQNAQFT